MLPEHAHLAFEPVAGRAPATLSADQVAHYNQHGYVAPFDVYSPAEAIANRDYFDRLLAQLEGRDASISRSDSGRRSDRTAPTP